MGNEVIERAFTKMGARVKFGELPKDRFLMGRRVTLEDFALDVRTDALGEYFLLSRAADSKTEFVVLDVQPKARHLLVMSRKESGNNRFEKHRFLAGHDERHWFVVGVPEETPVSQVRDAMTALKPGAVRWSERDLRAKDRNRRVTRARIRQGEWFFVPAPDLRVPLLLVLRDEPLIRRGGGKAHRCEEAFRRGGVTVYVSHGYPSGLTEPEHAALPDSVKKRQTWRYMRRDPEVYVRGRVRHPDHKTVTLDGWHRVASNTEHLSFAMRNIVFLD
jgi:hypothetical protein